MRLTARIATTFNRSGAAPDNAVATAVPALSRRAKGSGAPSPRRAPVALLAAFVVIASLAITAAPAAAVTSSEMGSISNVSYTSTHVTGKVTSDGSGLGGGPGQGVTKYTFEYSTDNANWSDGFSAFVSNSSGENVHGAFVGRSVQGDIEGLKGGTKYYVRLGSVNGFFGEGAYSPEPNSSFTTLPVDPPSILVLDNASEVAYTTATLSGEVERPANPDPAFDVSCHFQYVNDDQFKATGFEGPAEAPCETANPGETPGTVKAPGKSKVSAKITGLTHSTTYHVRLVVSNGSPTTDSKVAAQPFTTLTVGPPSVISIDNASEVEYTQAKVKGVVERPNTSPDPAFDVNCNFEYVTDQQFNDNPPGEEFAGATPVACEPEGNPAENPIHAEGQSTVKATLGGLALSTKYHLRLSASNLGGSDSKEAVATFTTQSSPPSPSVIATDDATAVTIHEAKVEGIVQRPAGADPGLNVECRFEYVSDVQFNETGFAGAPSAPCIENPIDPSKVDFEGKATVSAELGGLRADTTFHFRLAAENVGGVDTKDAANTFTTLPAELPTVTIDPILPDGYTTAHVSGTVDIDDPGHTTVNVFIERSDDGGLTWDGIGISGVPTQQGPGLHVVEKNFAGLQPNTTYTFRIKATYSGDPNGVEPLGEVVISPEVSVTTEPLFAPTATINPPTAITGTSAHLSGTVDPHAPAGPLSELGKQAFATSWHFDCTPACKDLNGNVIAGTVQGEEGAQPVGGDAIRLVPNTHYEVTLTISSEGGAETTEVKEFDTPVIPPTVQSALGASDGKGGYTLQGVVNPNNSPVTGCKFEWGPNAPSYAFSADCSPAPGAGSKPVTVEAHLTGLTPGATYHALLVVTYGAGIKADDGDHTFVPTLASAEPCPNEALRVENNSVALPECRAYEQVSDPNKAGASAILIDYSDSGAVAYTSSAGDIANSGRGEVPPTDRYVANRTMTKWETVSNLNGPSGSPFSGPEAAFGGSFAFQGYSADLQSSLWIINPGNQSPTERLYLRNLDGKFTLIGNTLGPNAVLASQVGISDDLTHVALAGRVDTGGGAIPPVYGPGIYEFVGTGNDLPRRVDVDNHGDPVSGCPNENGVFAKGNTVSHDGRVIVFTGNGTNGSCANGRYLIGSGPGVTGEVWVRVNGTTSYDASASLCTRTAADPGGGCNAPAAATFQGAAGDGSRIYFTTTQQLVNGDTDQTNDLYACDIPPGPQAPVGPVNSCSSLSEVSGPTPGGRAETVSAVSEDGSTVYFTAQGALANNKDALGETAVSGDHNFYVWRKDAAHPVGQTTFLARLDSNDVNGAQSTADGRYLVFTTANQLVATDTDNARDAYRYDADTNTMTRVSTNVSGVGGNSEDSVGSPDVSDDGDAIVFTTSEALSPGDGNGEPDIYLWRAGRVFLISTGSVGSAAINVEKHTPANIAISGSGRDIYFETPGALTPSDGDAAGDVYDARIGGGFSFAAAAVCSGEDGACQLHSSSPPSSPPSPANLPGGEGNVKPCPKGKVAKGDKCVKKKAKHHKKSHKKNKRAGHNRGGSK